MGKTKTVPLDFDLLLTAKALGVTLRRLSDASAEPQAAGHALTARRDTIIRYSHSSSDRAQQRHQEAGAVVRSVPVQARGR